MKFLKSLFVFIIVVVVILVTTTFVFVKSIAVDVTDANLPQNIYTETGDLQTIAELSLVGLVIANDEDRYLLINNFMNYMLLDSIRENVNSAYDPLGSLDTDAANYIIKEDVYYIDYVYSTLNEDNQIVICISFGTDKYITSHSCIYMYFDVDIDVQLLNITVTLTLSEYYIADHKLSLKILDYVFDKLGKTAVEDSMTMGTLNLDNYTYTVSIIE
jgi:hypothetical protein